MIVIGPLDPGPGRILKEKEEDLSIILLAFPDKPVLPACCHPDRITDEPETINPELDPSLFPEAPAKNKRIQPD